MPGGYVRLTACRRACNIPTFVMPLELADNEAHIWYREIPAPAQTPVGPDRLATLSADEQARYSRFRFERDRFLYLESHLLLRQTLSKYAALQPHEWLFRIAEKGRPEIDNAAVPNLRFNLTHTRGFAACVVTRAMDCGVDAERLEAKRNIEGVAARMFSPAETAALETLDGTQHLQAFYIGWTLREAYVKARGIGIGFPTHALIFAAEEGDVASLSAPHNIEPHPQLWHFRHRQLSESHLLSVAIRCSAADTPSFKYFPVDS